MEWHLNDLSIRGQFPDPSAFQAAIEPILRLRLRRRDIGRRIFCSRTLYLRPATRALSLHQALRVSRDKDFVRLALDWFANGGPFWDDARTANSDDYFHIDGEDVTDQGLGEAARRSLAGAEAGSLSVAGAGFDRTPLAVEHGLPEDPLGQIAIPNFWELHEVESHVSGGISSWFALMDSARASMSLLIFSDEILQTLQASPFHSGIAKRVGVLLRILQALAQETRDDSSVSDAGHEILRTHFMGSEALFTDESESNKRSFETELTFRDPLLPSAYLFCPWHGKINQGPFRIHFEWPRPQGQRQIKVVYIGPKITKH